MNEKESKATQKNIAASFKSSMVLLDQIVEEMSKGNKEFIKRLDASTKIVLSIKKKK